MTPHTGQTGKARRAAVMAALPGTALQIAERTGMPKSTVYYFLYTSPARRLANDPRVWGRPSC